MKVAFLGYLKIGGILDLFNEPEGCIILGYYDGCVTISRCVNPGEETIGELLEEISETDAPVEHVCVNLISDNGN